MNASRYPLRADVVRQDEYTRLLPLVKWLLALPHYVVLVFLGIAAIFAVLVSFFAVLFTRSYPRGLFDFVVGVQRWAWRVTAYVLLMTDAYPPFSFEGEGHPATFTIDYPEGGVDRWRPLVHWLLIIPYHLVAGVLMNLAGLTAFFALFTIVFTKRFPQGLFDLTLNSLRWTLRANAYAAWLLTRYPPFEWDPDR